MPQESSNDPNILAKVSAEMGMVVAKKLIAALAMITPEDFVEPQFDPQQGEEVLGELTDHEKRLLVLIDRANQAPFASDAWLLGMPAGAALESSFNNRFPHTRGAFVPRKGWKLCRMG